MTGIRAHPRPSASWRPVGSYCQQRTFIAADVNDRLWSAAAVSRAKLGKAAFLYRAPKTCHPFTGPLSAKTQKL